MIIPVILSGGSGTRLWPLSRKSKPKQFINLIGDESLFRRTAKRVLGDKTFGDIVVICNDTHQKFVEKELKDLNVKNNHILIEPIGRNTAPAITAASIFTQDICKDDDVMLVLSSDHLIKEPERFVEYLKHGKKLAEKGYLVTFSIVPTKPETGYGYIKKGEKINNSAYIVEKFVEKPNYETAVRFLDDGNYSWNSGIFMFKPSLMLENIKKYEESTYRDCLRACKNAQKKGNVLRLNKKDFERCNDISIDFAVMERTQDKIAVVPMDITWSDLGSFESLYENEEKSDRYNNVLKGDVLTEEVKNSYIRSENGKMIAAIGLDNVAIIETNDAILVINKDKSQLVRRIVKQLKNSDKEEHKKSL